MKIILSPAKKMKVDTDSIDTMSSPVFLEKTEEILGWMQGRTEEELKKLWKCNDKITTENIERIKTMNFQKQLTPPRLKLIFVYLVASTLKLASRLNRW